MLKQRRIQFIQKTTNNMEIYKNSKYRVTFTAEKNKPNDGNEKKKMNHQLIKILRELIITKLKQLKMKIHLWMNYQNFKIIIIILLNLISKLKENKLVYDYEKRNNEDLKNKNFSRNNLNQMKYRKKLKN